MNRLNEVRGSFHADKLLVELDPTQKIQDPQEVFLLPLLGTTLNLGVYSSKKLPQPSSVFESTHNVAVDILVVVFLNNTLRIFYFSQGQTFTDGRPLFCNKANSSS